ncbi:Hypothetical protein, putative [Bodo saltans]|uniref:Uncharacterized protein n=1 Tax=Bodo saltans TaxID=75058 RepID=A0A0S4JPJ3_BODSA|nr:Hypothetical protein, putative [Bodo saltans]|eukprot:CUG93444.1 Hypothetical protein, putative [Bodo saltans]
MSTQMQSRGWSVGTANHLADATAIMHAQIAKATARGLSVARVAETGATMDDSPQYSASGFRIKFASADAVARLIVVDCFAHEPLEEVVRHIRLLDAQYKLNTIICFLTTPRPTEGQGFVIAPSQLLTLADAYDTGVDLVIPTHFDQSVVEFLTEVFLSSSGRYMKGGGTSATTSIGDDVELLTNPKFVVRRNGRNQHPGQQLHNTKDVTGGVPNLEGFAVTSRKIGLDEDRLEEEVSEAQRREEKKRELKRQFLLQREKAANVIDTNPEYISLLSKYEICLRQLSSNKEKIADLNATIETMNGEKENLRQTIADEQAETERLKELLSAYQSREDSTGKERGTPAFHNQLVQREQRIAVLEKESVGFKAKYEATKKQLDDTAARLERINKENDEAKRHIINLNKRFENRLRALGVTGVIDLDEEVHKQNEQVNALKQDVYKWTRRTTVMRLRMEAKEVDHMEQHDVDGFGRTAGAIIGGFTQMMSKDQMRELLNARKAATYSTPRQGSLSASPPKDLLGLTPPLQSTSFSVTPQELPIIGKLPPRQQDESRMSVVSVGSDPSGSAETDVPSFLTAFGGMSALQFNDMTAPTTNNDRELCDLLVEEASKAVSEGDAVISSVKDQNKMFAEMRQKQQAENIGLGKIRASSMFADPQLARRRLSPAVVSPPSEAAIKWATNNTTQRAEETLTSLQSISDRIGAELAALVQSAELANRNEEQNRKHLDVAVHDFMHLSRAAPVPTYEAVLQKLRSYTAGEVQKRERNLASGTLRAEELERVASEFARWQVILDEVDEKLSSFARSRESGSTDQRRREQLEQQLDVLEAKAMRLIPELTVTRDPSNYVATQKEIFVLRRELKKLPGGRLKIKRGALSPRSPPALNASIALGMGASLGAAAAAGLMDSTSSTGSGGSSQPTGPAADEPLSILDVAEKALTAHLEATRIATADPEAPRHAVHRRSTALVGELQSLQSVMAQSGALLESSFQSVELGRQAAANLNTSAHDAEVDTNEKPFSTPDRETPLSPPKAHHAMFAPGTPGVAGAPTANNGAMHNVAADMLQRFRSYSVVKKGQLNHSGGSTASSYNAATVSSSNNTMGLRDLVGGIRTMVQAKLDAAQESVQQISQQVRDDVKGVLGETSAFGELNFRHIEALFEQTKDINTPTVLYQLILVYHRDVVRLLRQLRKRTSLTSVNIIDAHHLQKQLLKENRPLTKSQADNIPFILSVDAAQVARFADYFERETEMLVKEGISRLQRHVEEVSAKNLNVDIKSLHVAEHHRARSTSISDGAPTAVQSPQTTSLPTSTKVSRRPSMDTRGSKELAALPLKQHGGLSDELSFAIPAESVQTASSNVSPVDANAVARGAHPSHRGKYHVDVPQASSSHQLQPFPTHEPLSARRPSADEVQQSTALLLGVDQQQQHVVNNARLKQLVASAMRIGTPRLPASGAQQAVLSTTLFGSAPMDPHYNNGELVDPQSVIYLPRTPAISQPSRPAMARKHELTTSRQRLIDDAMHRIMMHSAGNSGGGAAQLPHLPDWSSRIPPPSRQRMLQQQQQQQPHGQGIK